MGSCYRNQERSATRLLKPKPMSSDCSMKEAASGEKCTLFGDFIRVLYLLPREMGFEKRHDMYVHGLETDKALAVLDEGP